MQSDIVPITVFATSFVDTGGKDSEDYVIDTGINDPGGKFATGISNTGCGEIATGGNDTSGIFYQISKKF
jgi:hypothetical protein